MLAEATMTRPRHTCSSVKLPRRRLSAARLLCKRLPSAAARPVEVQPAGGCQVRAQPVWCRESHTECPRHLMSRKPTSHPRELLEVRAAQKKDWVLFWLSAFKLAVTAIVQRFASMAVRKHTIQQYACIWGDKRAQRAGRAAMTVGITTPLDNHETHICGDTKCYLTDILRSCTTRVEEGGHPPECAMLATTCSLHCSNDTRAWCRTRKRSCTHI